MNSMYYQVCWAANHPSRFKQFASYVNFVRQYNHYDVLELNFFYFACIYVDIYLDLRAYTMSCTCSKFFVQ